MAQELEVISISDSSSASLIFRIPPVAMGVQNDDSQIKTKQTVQHDDTSVAAITLSSDTSTQRCPVTWSNYKLYRQSALKRFGKNYLESPKTKVSAWLNQNYDSMLKHVEVPQPENFLTSTENNGILVRRDYKKIIKNDGNVIQPRQVSQYKLSCNEVICVDSNSRSNSPAESHSQENVSSKVETEPIENLSTHEMQKKLELYEYLKLMDKKPQRKIKLELAQNRRSSRVKNLVLLNNKRAALEKQRNGEIDTQNKAVKSSQPRRSCSKEFSDSNNSKDSKPRSVSVASSLIKSSVENVPKIPKSSSGRLAVLNSKECKTRVGSQTKTIHLKNIEFLQVPEVTSTSIASSNTILQAAVPVLTKQQTSLTNIQNDSTRSTKTKSDKSSRNVLKLDTGLPLVKNKASTSSISSTTSLRKYPKKQKLGITVKNKIRKPKTTRTHNNFNHKLTKKLRYTRKRKPEIKSSKRKTIERKRHFGNPLRLNRLRSRGKLKRLRLGSILFKSKKRRMIKKKFDHNLVPKFVELKNKPFVSSDLIQPGTSQMQNYETDIKLFKSNYLYNELTPEHLSALVESRKFLDINTPIMSPKERSSSCAGFNNSDVNISTTNLEKINSVVDCIDDCLSKRLESDHFTSEDLEVGRFMDKVDTKRFLRKVYGHLYEDSTSNGQRSLTGEDVRCTSSYPQSSESLLNDGNHRTKASTGRVSAPNMPGSSTGMYELLTSGTSQNGDNDDGQEVISLSQIEPNNCECQEMRLDKEIVPKTLNDCLSQPLVKPNKDLCSRENWLEKKSLLSHTVSISPKHGDVLGAYYMDFNLIVVQKVMVSFWSQTPLGNILGAQDMWLPRGNTERLILENGCVRKESSEVMISLFDSVAYIELWTKEHKSEKRERPLADIFVAVYLTLNRGGCSKKVLQLENIHGFASDVQYIVIKNSRNIIVSWNIMNENVSSTLVHCYELSPDYQTVRSIKEVQSVDHYLSSLHNIEDCDNIIMGCGDQKITLWNCENLDYCYVIATIDLLDIPPLRTLWAKCDRGFLFTLHELNNGLLQLIAINSSASTWKRLRTYNKPEMEYDRLTGVCIENGLLVACYDTGLSCWNAQTGDLILEGQYNNQLFLAFGSHIVIVLKDEVHVRQALEYIISMEEM